MTGYFLDIATSGKNCTLRVLFLMLVVATIHSQSKGTKAQKRIVYITELSHHLVSPIRYRQNAQLARYRIFLALVGINVVHVVVAVVDDVIVERVYHAECVERAAVLDLEPVQLIAHCFEL
jgi:hypothetical protein